jgi:C1A family cysteine protease
MRLLPLLIFAGFVGAAVTPGRGARRLCAPGNHPPASVCGYLDYLARYHRVPPTNHRSFVRRYNVYIDNLRYIDARDDEGLTYTLGMNAYTDMSREEFASTRLAGIRKDHPPTPAPTQYGWTVPKGLPTSVDWRANGWVVPVKDQGACGSCWAFSAVGATEGQHANATGKLVSLSEQNLVDCAGAYGCDGCGGGWPEAAMRYVAANGGIDTEQSYPYTGGDGSCSYAKAGRGSTVTSTVNVTAGSMPALYKAIAEVGPISVAIDAESDFQFYAAGVFSSTTCSSQFLDHAVLAVGYGETESGTRYIMVKNSWGADWGMDGYIYMAADPPNMCGIAAAASYPIIEG